MEGTTSQLSDGKDTTVPTGGRKPKPRGKYERFTVEQKQAALVEYTKIKAELARGVKYGRDWLKMLCQTWWHKPPHIAEACKWKIQTGRRSRL